MRLTWYLSSTLVKFAVVAALILAFIAEVLDLVENAEEVLDQGDGLVGILRYVALKMPTLLTHSLPLGALVGGLLCLLLLARNSEIVAMRSAGVGTWRLYVMMVPGALLLVLTQSTLLDVIAPKTEERLSLMLTKQVETEETEAEATDKEAKPIWLRIGDAVVSFEHVSNRGRKLRNLRVYDRGPNKQVTARTMAAEARYEKRRWILKDAERVNWGREGFNTRTPADGPWETVLTPEDVISALSPEARISLSAARAVLSGRMTPNAPLPFYQTLIERVYSAPLAPLVMVLLAMPAALVNWRDTRTGRHGVYALVAGLFFILCDGLWSTLALTGVISPAVGAWSALFVFAIFGAIRVTRIDGAMRRTREPLLPPRARTAGAGA